MTAISLKEGSELVLRKAIDFPNQLGEALALLKEHKTSFQPINKNNRSFSNIVILGMGGSGVVGDLIRVLTRNSALPIFVCKNSIPPHFISSSSLVIAVTYSGKTKETLAALSNSLCSGACTLVITSSTELYSSCIEKDIPCILIPENGFPRLSLGFMLVPILGFLEKCGILHASIEDDINEAIEVLNTLRKEYILNVPSKKNPAWTTADELSRDKFPIVYGECNFTDVIALRWKQQLNENSKIHCHYDSFPELLHNEIEAWNMAAYERNNVVILLRDTKHELDIGINGSVAIAKNMMERAGSRVIELWTAGSSDLARLLSLIYIGDIVSVYLAFIRGVNPSTIPNIELAKHEDGQSNNNELKT